MNAQIIILLLLAIAVTAIAVNFGLWSDLKQAQADLSDTEAAAAFFERECEYERQEMEAAVCIIREMQEDLAFAEQDLAASRYEVDCLQDLLAAIQSAAPITADIWSLDDDSEVPF